jgi:hypothetical protein
MSLRALIIAAAAVACVVASGSASGAGATTLHVSPSGSDSGTCAADAPCRSFDRAYHVARPGQVVEVAAGTYDGQRLTLDRSKTSRTDVVFRPAGGARVVVSGEVRIYAKHITFENMHFRGDWWEDGDDLTFRNIDTEAIFLHGTNIRVIGGQVYPGPDFLDRCTTSHPTCDFDPQISDSSARRAPPENVLIDHVWFHGWLRPHDSGFHTECLQVGAGINVVIRRSRFTDCATHDLFIRSWGTLNDMPNTLRNWTIENNVFGRTTDGYYVSQFMTDLDTSGRSDYFVYRNNSWAQPINIDVQPGTHMSVIGNVGELSQQHCRDSGGLVVWSYNVWDGARCGPTDMRAPSDFVNENAGNLRPAPNSPAINHGDPKDFPRVDIDGRQRPRGGAPDAGAYEVR